MRRGTRVPRREWGRHRRLLQNPDVKRWYDNLARGSPVTADVRLRRLGVYCETAGTTPGEFAGTGARDVRAADDLLMDHVSLLESRGYAPSYINDILKCLRSWLSFNYVRSVRRIRIKNADMPVTLQDEVVPSKSKLGELLDAAPARERVSISLMAFSGVFAPPAAIVVGARYYGSSDCPIRMEDSKVMCSREPANATSVMERTSCDHFRLPGGNGIFWTGGAMPWQTDMPAFVAQGGGARACVFLLAVS